MAEAIEDRLDKIISSLTDALSKLNEALESFVLSFQLRSISSSVRCFVSGIIFQTNSSKIIAFTIKMPKVKAPPIFSRRIGVNCVINRTPIHRTRVQNDIAMPRVLVGNISDMMTQGMGPSDEAKLAM